jgi:CRISPR-associated protein Cas1
VQAAGRTRKDLLLEVPVSRRLSWSFIERGRLHADAHSLVLDRDGQVLDVPPAAFAALLLEPGVSVTHEAVRLCSENRVVLIWVGEAGTRLYAATSVHADPKRIVGQALIAADVHLRIESARRLYLKMFGEPAPPSYTIEKLRGIEGARVRKIYEQLASDHGLTWDGRAGNSALQTSISYASNCLYALSEVAIILLGFSPAIGIVHSGDARSFVYDLADTVKFNTLIPSVFRWNVEGMDGSFQAVRSRCRDLFRETSLLDVLVGNADFLVFGDDGRSYSK